MRQPNMEPEREIARYFDCCEAPGQRKMNTRMSGGARRELVLGLQAVGLEGKTILEVGCGPGDLTRELVRKGGVRALGIDLAEQTLEEGRKRAAEDGLDDRITYRIGNGAKEIFETHDVVVLDKVICCYPDWMELVSNTAGAAGSVYGFVIPRSDGISAVFVRAFIALQRFILKMRKCGFVPFVHDFTQIDAYLARHGLRRTHLDLGPIWMTAVYAR